MNDTLDGIKKRNSWVSELCARAVAALSRGRQTKLHFAFMCKVYMNYMCFAMQIFGERVAFFYSYS